MLGKLAYRNAKRSIKDYLIYLITITISFSLILAFYLVAGSEEVERLSSGMGMFEQILAFINVVIVFVVCFLINYTTKFMFEKRSREFGTYMLLGIRKRSVAGMLVAENILVGFLSFALALPFGFVLSQLISLVIVKLLGVPDVIFISMNIKAVGSLAVCFFVIYLLVLVNLLRKVRKMTVHDFLYLEKKNEKKMFRSSKRRNVIFILSAVLGIAALWLWFSQCSFEASEGGDTMTYMLVSMIGLIVSIYGVSATCADLILSVILKSKKIKYQKDTLFVGRTFASKARTMSFTFGTLSMLILTAVLCLNVSSIYKGVYRASIEMNAPYDVSVFDDKEALGEYLDVIEEDYTVEDAFEYDVYKNTDIQIQQYFKHQFYEFDAVMRLSDYNRLKELKGKQPVAMAENEYILATDSQLLYNFEDNENIRSICMPDGRKLALKDIETDTYWIAMSNQGGGFVVIVPDACVQGMELLESHLIVDTKEETKPELKEKLCREMRHRLIRTNAKGETVEQNYRVRVRGLVVEEQNTMTAMIASFCLYIAFILISAVGTVLAVQCLSDSAKYRYRYVTLRRLGVNDKSLYQTVRKQLLIMFGVPTVYSLICCFCMVGAINNVYKILLESEYVWLLYFAGSLFIFFLIYGIYWIAAYMGFKRNINEV